MRNVDVSGWRPTWADARTQLRLHDMDLQSLRGRRVLDAWIVWDLDRDTWFADLPVVLQFDDGRQLEICWQKFDELSISWNTIDTAIPPTAWVSWSLDWRVRAHPAFDEIIGRNVTHVEGTEHLLTTRRLLPPGDGTSAWLCSGIWLQAGDVGLHVFNALDENGLSNEPPIAGPTLRRISIQDEVTPGPQRATDEGRSALRTRYAMNPA